MNKSEIEDIIQLDCESRYEVFLTMVNDTRDIWILINDNNEFLKIDSGGEFTFLPVWPSEELANLYIANAEDGLKAKAISAPDFLGKWVKGLDGDNLQVGVFPNSGEDVWVIEASELKSDLQEEFSNFSM